MRHMRSLRVGEMTVVRGYRAILEDLLHVWEVYQAWMLEMDGYFGRLNDQVGGSWPMRSS